jgi:hypothetical protein
MAQAFSHSLLAVCLLAHELPAQQDAASQYRYRISYATYIGGSAGEGAREIIVHPDNTVLVGAQTSSPDMTVTPGAVQPKYAGDDPALGHGGVYGGDCFLVRLGANGQKILAATYFGGSKQERNVYGMGLDQRGNVVITSMTRSPDLPTTAGSFQPKYGGGPTDWFVAKISSDLSRLLWCTYIGGSGGDSPRGGLAVDDQDSVYVVGGTGSSDFPTTRAVYQRDRRGERDAAIVKLKPDGSGLVFSTLLGGSDWDGLMGVRVGETEDVYVAGHTRSADFPVTDGAPQRRLGGLSDSFLGRLSSDGSKLLYSTFLGGKLNEFAEHRPGLAPDGAFILTGVTGSADFPITARAFQRTLKGKTDGFLTKLSADGKKFVLSTLLGGSAGDFWLMPTLDGQGNIYVVGQTSSRDFPVTGHAIQRTYRGGPGDGALAIFSPDGSTLLYATFLGGSDADLVRSVALGPDGEVYLVGSTASEDFPVTAQAAQTRHGGKTDVFVVKLVPDR